MKLLALIIILSPVFVFGQEARSLGIRMSRQEIFLRYGMSYRQGNTQFELGAGCGVINSVFQQNLMPEWFGRTSLLLIQKEKIQLGISIHLAQHTLEYNPVSHARIYTSELLSGLILQTGKKWLFRFHAEWGAVNYWQPARTSNALSGRYYTYSGQLSLAHAL